MFNLRGTSKSQLGLMIATVLGGGGTMQGNAYSPYRGRSRVGSSTGIVTAFSQCKYFRANIDLINRRIDAASAWNRLTNELSRQRKLSNRGQVKVSMLTPVELHEYKKLLAIK